jgi:hypothetical protein
MQPYVGAASTDAPHVSTIPPKHKSKLVSATARKPTEHSTYMSMYWKDRLQSVVDEQWNKEEANGALKKARAGHRTKVVASLYEAESEEIKAAVKAKVQELHTAKVAYADPDLLRSPQETQLCVPIFRSLYRLSFNKMLQNC